MNPELIRAYQDALYCVHIEDKTLQLEVGESNEVLNQIMREYACNSCALITAHNPRSKILTDTENKNRSTKLEQMIKAQSFLFYPGFSTDKNETWPKETSFLIFNISLQQANILANQFQQNAFLWISKGKPVDLKIVELE